MDKQYFVRHEGRVPHDIVELAWRNEEVVAFFPAGGGFQHRMPTARFDATHRVVSSAELEECAPYAGTFDIDGMFGGLPGYACGRRWNGWACPYFPRESCDRIVAAIGNGAHFDEETETYLLPEEDASGTPGGFERYPAEHITVAGARVRVWAIGSGAWTWEEESAPKR